MLRMMTTAALLATTWTLQSQDSPQPKLPGLEIGKKAPDFELKDQRGTSRKLSDMLKKGSVAIVFHRSAGW